MPAKLFPKAVFCPRRVVAGAVAAKLLPEKVGPGLECPLATELGLPPFRPRWPWWSSDLQTLRDTLRNPSLGPDQGQPILTDLGQGDRLLSSLDGPLDRATNRHLGQGDAGGQARGLVLVLHGLGGSSQAAGVRRLGQLLQRNGFAVLRPNLRGAGQGRPLARGSYAAQCNRDLLPLLAQARQLAQGRPLLAVGLSLGGTVLLNGCLAEDSLGSPSPSPGAMPRLDGLACVSSPLDLVACSAQIDQPRNRLYQRWLLQRLHRQVRTDPQADRPGGLPTDRGGPAPSIRSFDTQITAPLWGYPSVEAYYTGASPLTRLLQGAQGRGLGLPPALWLHASDDPWVPANGTKALAAALAKFSKDRGPGRGDAAVLITPGGGHNGFHGQGDPITASWSDRLVLAWLLRLVQSAS